MSGSVGHFNEQEAIDRVASAWLVRIEEERLDTQGEAEFRRWLAEDPRHRAAYDAMREIWTDLAELEVADLAPTWAASTFVQSSASPIRPVRRWAAGIAVAASLAIILLLGLRWFLPNDPRYQTELAETRIVTLPDGSSVTVGARSSITVAYTRSERRVILSSGEAFFDVIHDPRRPFLVDAGTSLIRDVGTKFNVNRTSDDVRIGVTEGRVEVSRVDRPRLPAVMVSGGQGVQVIRDRSVASETKMQPPALRVTPQSSTGAWRDGRLVFENVRLADLSADVNRYYAPGITLGSAKVGDLRVTAAFKTNEIPAFMEALQAILPVRTERTAGDGFRIIDKAS